MNDLQKTKQKEKKRYLQYRFCSLRVETPFLVLTEFIYAFEFCFTNRLFSLPSIFKLCFNM